MFVSPLRINLRENFLTFTGQHSMTASRHSLWVLLKASSSIASEAAEISSQSAAIWNSKQPEGKHEAGDSMQGACDSVASLAGVSVPLRTGIPPRPEANIASWPRRVIRQITNHPDKYVISRVEPSAKLEVPGSKSSTTTAGRGEGDDSRGKGYRSGTGQTNGERYEERSMRQEDGFKLPDAAKLKVMLSGWTRAMDEELKRMLDTLAESAAFGSLLCFPFVSLESPPNPATFPLISAVAPADIRARAALLLHVNELILPLLPLVDTATHGRGYLGASIRKYRHVLLHKAKLSVLRE